MPLLAAVPSVQQDSGADGLFLRPAASRPEQAIGPSPPFSQTASLGPARSRAPLFLLSSHRPPSPPCLADATRHVLCSLPLNAVPSLQPLQIICLLVHTPLVSSRLSVNSRLISRWVVHTEHSSMQARGGCSSQQSLWGFSQFQGPTSAGHS